MIRIGIGIMGLIVAQSIALNALAQQSGSELGSSLTWDQIQNQRMEPLGVEPWRQRFAVPAAEPIPAFKYRFYSKPSQMRSAKGAVHLGRAMLMWEQVSESVLRKWEGSYAALDSGNAVPQDLAEQIKPFRSVFDELHALADCDDLQWRLSLKDLKGIERFQYLLPEVQVSRDLGRMLRTAAISHASQGEFDEAVRSLRSGFRLAEMVGNGETLLHQLVGIAIHQLMLEAVLDVIVAPNSPNLYWAIAELPRNRPGMRGAMDFEIEGVESMLPILVEAESSNRSAEDWKQLWRETNEHIKGLEVLGLDTAGLLDFLPLALAAGRDGAQARLTRCGFSKGELDLMPDERLLALDALYEIRTIGDELKKDLLRSELSPQQLVKGGLNQDGLLKNNGYRTLGRMLASQLMPAPTHQVQLAQKRIDMIQARLMTLEAIRMTTSHQGGIVPRKLAELQGVAPIADPFSKRDFEYQVEPKDGYVVVRLTSMVPDELQSWRTLEVRVEGK